MNNITAFNDHADPASFQERIAKLQPVPSNDEVLVDDVTSSFAALPQILSADATIDAPVPETIALATQRWAAMGPVEYEQVRKMEAKAWSIRVAMLAHWPLR